MGVRSYTDEELRVAVATNISMAATLRALGLRDAGGNYRTLRSLIAAHGLDTSHWLGQAHLRGKTHRWSRRRPLEEVLVQDSDYAPGALRKRIEREGLLPKQCAMPGCLFHEGSLEYLGRPVRLHLDHINGDNRDHRLENLRFLCPLCHSQTDTYTGRNLGRYLQPRRVCVDCGKAATHTLRCAGCRTALAPGRHRERYPRVRNCVDCETPITAQAQRCVPCYRRQCDKIAWPPADQLLARVASSSCSAVAKELGVSDTAVWKRLRRARLL